MGPFGPKQRLPSSVLRERSRRHPQCLSSENQQVPPKLLDGLRLRQGSARHGASCTCRTVPASIAWRWERPRYCICGAASPSMSWRSPAATTDPKVSEILSCAAGTRTVHLIFMIDSEHRRPAVPESRALESNTCPSADRISGPPNAVRSRFRSMFLSHAFFAGVKLSLDYLLIVSSPRQSLGVYHGPSASDLRLTEPLPKKLDATFFLPHGFALSPLIRGYLGVPVLVESFHLVPLRLCLSISLAPENDTLRPSDLLLPMV